MSDASLATKLAAAANYEAAVVPAPTGRAGRLIEVVIPGGLRTSLVRISVVAIGVSGVACTAADSGGNRTAAAVVAARIRSAEPIPQARLDSLAAAIEARRRQLGVPGAAVVIVRPEGTVFLRGFGLRDVAGRLPVTPRTLFAIASCTKPFTALAALIAADQGILSLDDSPRRFLPYFHLRDPAADSLVTLRDLLSHRTGVPDDLGGGWFERYGTRERLIRAAMASKPEGAFRASFHYNNYMFLAAGEAVAAAMRMPYEEVLRQEVFEPLVMRRTSLSLDSMEASADFAYGYEDSARTSVRPTRLVYNSAMAPAANINSNAEDMGQWIRMLSGGGVLDGRRLISELGFQAMLAPAVRTSGGHYALGWFVEDWHRLRLYSHPGGTTGYGSRCEFLPDQRLGWVVLTNVDDQQLPKAVREIVYETLLSPPRS